MCYWWCAGRREFEFISYKSCCVSSAFTRLDFVWVSTLSTKCDSIIAEWIFSWLHTTHFGENSNIQLFSNKNCQLNSDIIISCFPSPACFSRMKHVLCRTCFPYWNYISLLYTSVRRSQHIYILLKST